MKTVKTLSLAVASMLACSAQAEMSFNSAEGTYKFNHHNFKKDSEESKNSGIEHNFELSGKVNLDFGFASKLTLGHGIENKEIRAKAKGAKSTYVDSNARNFEHELSWKDGDLGKVAYTFSTHAGNQDSSDAAASSEKAAERNHKLDIDAYLGQFTLGGYVDTNRSLIGKDVVEHGTGLRAKFYATDNIRLGLERSYLGFNSKKDFENIAEVETRWLNGMVDAGASYKMQDETGKKVDIVRSAHVSFRPLMIAEKVTFDLKYEQSDTDRQVLFTVGVSTDKVGTLIGGDR